MLKQWCALGVPGRPRPRQGMLAIAAMGVLTTSMLMGGALTPGDESQMDGAGGAASCVIDDYIEVMPPALAEGDGYGSAVASIGSWTFVGAPGDDLQGPDAGAVHVFYHDGNRWTYHGRLHHSGAAVTGFGVALAADDERLIVGAESRRAFIFRFDGRQWVQEQELQAFGEGAAVEFGMAVAVRGNVAVVNGRYFSLPGSRRALYVFRFQGDHWQPEQRLAAEAVGNIDDFGGSLTIGEGVIMAGASLQSCGSEPEAGAVYEFRHDGVKWAQHARFCAPDAARGQWFGAALALEDDVLAVGSPGDSGGQGAVYVFRRERGEWTAAAKLSAPSAFPAGALGAALDVRDGVIAAGAPQSTYNGPESGAVAVFRPQNGTWTWAYPLVRYYLPPSLATQSSVVRCGFTLIGGSLSWSSRGVMAGARSRVCHESFTE